MTVGLLAVCCFAPSQPGLAAAPGACSLARVPFVPVEGSNLARYAGQGRRVRFELENGRPGQVAEVFPEPPLVIRDLASGRSCEVKDGGVWVGGDFYLSADEGTLLAHEHSGSNDSVVLYDTATCKPRRTVDVTGVRWRVDGDALSIGRRCSGADLATCRSVKAVALGVGCGDAKTTPRARRGVDAKKGP